ncbi:type III pantothenate kinase [Paenalcaligenes niemegkensis]|uniref:type III pantothenate kinase n=1 Tax=Paenalcaligenes niemegkensis TaxID=2895469 RepID=UPI001EE96A17|nr:type III pantothenate kinase [Paenalcaligenes niemegkensis]MCQ9617615.1 type III pantothenate kinase [Paenalcaligenes niemegkensis]
MILLIDMGNTRTKLRLFEPDALTHHSDTAAFPHNELNQITDWLKKTPRLSKVAYGINVVDGALTSRLECLLLAEGVQIQWLDGTTPYTSLANSYQSAQKLGPDRWFSAIGLIATLRLPAQSMIHASFGTATTVDTIRYDPQTHQYRFLGGTILPGPLLMHQSLASRTANLGFGEGELELFPTETRSAITTGIAAAQTGAVMRQWLATYELDRKQPLLICSGGGWDYVETALKSALQQERHLAPFDSALLQWRLAPALDGIAAIARQRQSKDSTG